MNYTKKDLLYLQLGGSGEIVMNCNLYHYEDKWIMIDLGVMFGNSNLSSNELIMPNIEFLIKNNIKLDGLILTHAHEDHIGAVPFLGPVASTCYCLWSVFHFSPQSHGLGSSKEGLGKKRLGII